MNYIIKHTQVGPWEEGRVISEDEMKATVPNIDIGRLKELKAIMPSIEPLTDTPVPVGPQNPTKPGSPESYKGPGEPTDEDKKAADEAEKEPEKEHHSSPVPTRPTRKG